MISQKEADANINLDAASAIFPASRTAAERRGSAIVSGNLRTNRLRLSREASAD